MELFRDGGHLTDEGLQAVIGGEPDELSRLEASEHLSFCDECLVRYLAMVEEAPLMEPEIPIRKNVMRRLKKQARTILFSRYATVAAAVCLVAVMWGSGFFRTITSLVEEHRDTSSQGAAGENAIPEEPKTSFFSDVVSGATGAVGGFFDSLNPTGAVESPQQRESNRIKAEREKKEAVFDQAANGKDPAGDDTGTQDK